MKKKPALIAAFITTFVIAAAMLLVGFSAFFNPDSVPVSNSPTSAVSADPAGTTTNISAVSANTSSDQLKQLQDLIAQYQQREQQYQQQEQQLQTQQQQLQNQLNQATSMVQQYQNLLAQLQARGVISIDQNGRISIPRRFGDYKATQGKVGALPGQQSTQLGMYNQLVRKTDPGYSMIAVPFPRARKDGPMPTAWFEAVVTSSGAAITTTSKKVDAAIKVCDYLYSPEGHLLINFGKEGESYTMVNGRPMFTDLIKKNPNGLGLAQAIARYGMMSASGPFVKSREWSYQKADDPVLLDALNVWMKSAVNKALPEGLSPTSEESKKLATIMGRVNTYMDEMFVKFVTGAEPIANYSAFVENLKKLGIDDALAVQQAAIDRWAKR